MLTIPSRLNQELDTCCPNGNSYLFRSIYTRTKQRLASSDETRTSHRCQPGQTDHLARPCGHGVLRPGRLRCHHLRLVLAGVRALMMESVPASQKPPTSQLSDNKTALK